jgi:hypothetical protein
VWHSLVFLQLSPHYLVAYNLQNNLLVNIG